MSKVRPRPYSPSFAPLSKCLIGGAAAVLLSLTFLQGCTTATSAVTAGPSLNRNLLLEAGFTASPANAQMRKDILHGLTANRFLQTYAGGTEMYLFSDPIVCGCLYRGSLQAYLDFRSRMALLGMATPDEMRAETWKVSDWTATQNAWEGH